jgi:peptidoglycan/xylan/chitin deacetylase (PgdA/CDA1 family)
MRVVSSLLKRVVYPCLAGAGYFRSRKRTGLAVITYHGVVPADYQPIDPGLDGSLVTAETFRRQLQLLKSNYNVISPEDMFSWCRKEYELPPRAVLITCDDGLQNNVEEMLPILQEEGLRCLFFVTGASTDDVSSTLWYQELLGLLLRARPGRFHLATAELQMSGVLKSPGDRRKLCWNMIKRLSRIDVEGRQHFLRAADDYFGIERAEFDSHLRRHFGVMTRAHLKTLADSGMTIGAHTVTHPVLAEQPPQLALAEILKSRALLESVLGQKIWAFAYPFGGTDSISPRVFAMARDAGFAAAFINIGGGFGTDLPLHAIPRVHVNSDMTVPEFEAHVSGFYQALLRSFGRASATAAASDFDSSGLRSIEEPVSK